MKHFSINTDIYFGTDALDRLLSIPYRPVVVMTDPYLVSSGLIRTVTDRLEKTGIPYRLYTDIVPEPPVDKVIAAVSFLLQNKEPAIIAVGGGSSIDTAKSVRYFAGKMDPDYRPALIAVPTTSGTGSEVTRYAVLSDRQSGRKVPITDDSLIPDEAISDVILVKSVPSNIVADTGMDVLTHALESYVSTDNNEFSGALAEKAVEIVGQFLYRSYVDAGDTHARQKIHVAATLAGLAFNSSSLGICHSMAHQLGAEYHIPHGRANALLLPYIIEYNSGIGPAARQKDNYPPCVRKYCNMAHVLGISGINEVTTVRALISYIHFLNGEMNIPSSLSDMLRGRVGHAEYTSSLQRMAENALKDTCTPTNPRVPTERDIIDLYEKIWGND